MLGSRAHNTILAALSTSDRADLDVDLHGVELERDEVIVDAGAATPFILFPQGSLLSLIVLTESGHSVEVGLIGSDGVFGTWLAAGVTEAPWRAIVQSAGPALRIETSIFATHLAANVPLHQAVSRYGLSMHVMTAQAVACSRFHDLIQRTATWLLTASDRMAKDDLALTQEFVSQMVGAYRPSVTVALASLTERGFIALRRGHIVLIDRAGLRGVACECYERVRVGVASA